jgi:transposase InsO family protein
MTYGAPRIHIELREEHGIRVGEKRVARLMRTAGLVGIHRRKNPNPRDAKPAPAAARAFPNLVQRDFTTSAPDRVWLADITQHPTREGWLHLAVVMDVFSRRIVGWSMDSRMQAELVVDALEMAIGARRPPLGCCNDPLNPPNT